MTRFSFIYIFTEFLKCLGRAPVQTKGKWADTSYKLCDRYIPYALGGGYVLGRELVKFVADNSRILEPYNSEDATLGAWMAGLKVNRKHDTRCVKQLIDLNRDLNVVDSTQNGNLEVAPTSFL